MLNMPTHILCDMEAAEFMEMWSQFGGGHTNTTAGMKQSLPTTNSLEIVYSK